MVGSIVPDAERAKREEFLALVTCGIQVMLQEAYSRPGLEPAVKARILSDLISELSAARSAADKIPSDASALGAALDVLDHVFGTVHLSEDNPDRSWLDEIDEGDPREHRTDWAGYQPHSVWQETLAQFRLEMRQQAKPIEDNTQPQGGSNSVATPAGRYHARKRAARVDRIQELHKTLEGRKILEAIRRLGRMQLKEIGPLVPGMKRLALRAFMTQLREAGWIECVGRGGGAAWAASEKLTASATL